MIMKTIIFLPTFLLFLTLSAHADPKPVKIKKPKAALMDVRAPYEKALGQSQLQAGDQLELATEKSLLSADKIEASRLQDELEQTKQALSSIDDFYRFCFGSRSCRTNGLADVENSRRQQQQNYENAQWKYLAIKSKVEERQSKIENIEAKIADNDRVILKNVYIAKRVIKDIESEGGSVPQEIKENLEKIHEDVFSAQ